MTLCTHTIERGSSSDSTSSTSNSSCFETLKAFRFSSVSLCHGIYPLHHPTVADHLLFFIYTLHLCSLRKSCCHVFFWKLLVLLYIAWDMFSIEFSKHLSVLVCRYFWFVTYCITSSNLTCKLDAGPKLKTAASSCKSSWKTQLIMHYPLLVTVLCTLLCTRQFIILKLKKFERIHFNSGIFS